MDCRIKHRPRFFENARSASARICNQDLVRHNLGFPDIFARLQVDLERAIDDNQVRKYANKSQTMLYSPAITGWNTLAPE